MKRGALAGIVLSIVCLGLHGISSAQDTPTYASLISAGIKKLGQEDLDSAMSLFQKALDADPKGVEALYYIGVTHARAGRIDSAEGAFQQALAEDPTFIPAYFELGVLYYVTERDDKALAAFQVVVKKDPQRARVYYYEGLILRRNGREGEAAEKLEKAASLDPDLAVEASYRAGEAYYRSGELKSARRMFRSVVALAPDSEAGRFANEFLARTEEKRWYVILSAGMQYDTNVLLESSQGPVAASSVTNQRDYAGVFYLRGGYRWLDTPKWLGRAQYSFYQNLHTKENLSDFNIRDQHVNLEAGRKFGRFELRLQYEVQFTTLGGDKYLLKNSAGVRLPLQESNANLTELSYWYGYTNFYDIAPLFPNNSDRDARLQQVGARHNWVFGDSGNLHGGYLLEINRAGDTPVQDDWSFDGHHITVGTVLPPWKRLVFSADLEYVIFRFREPNEQSPGGTRDDSGPIFIFSVLRSLGSRFDLSIQYLYQQNNSNISVYDYRRAIYGLIGTGRF